MQIQHKVRHNKSSHLQTFHLQQPKGLITLIDYSYVEGSIYCKILREPRSVIFGRNFDLINNQYHLLIASGKGVQGKFVYRSTLLPFSNLLIQINFNFNKNIDNSIGYHDVGRLASGSPRYLADVSALGGASKLFLRLHAAFMITAWIGTASVGILLARYFKQTWVGSQLCGKDQWFAVSISSIENVIRYQIYNEQNCSHFSGIACSWY